MTKIKHLFLCFMLCMPLILPLSVQTVHADNSTYVELSSIEINFLYNSTPGIYKITFSSPVRAVCLRTSEPFSQIYFVSDKSFVSTYTVSCNGGPDYLNKSSSTSNSASVMNYQYDTFGSMNMTSNSAGLSPISDSGNYVGNYSNNAVAFTYGSKSIVPVPSINLGRLDNVRYSVNRTDSTINTISDNILWNNLFDTNGNHYVDGGYSVDIRIIPAQPDNNLWSNLIDNYTRNSIDELYNWRDPNNDTNPEALTYSVDASSGSWSMSWLDILDKWGKKSAMDIFSTKTNITQADVASYTGWHYYIRLVHGDDKTDWSILVPVSESGSAKQLQNFINNTNVNDVQSIMNNTFIDNQTTKNGEVTNNYANISYNYTNTTNNAYDSTQNSTYTYNSTSTVISPGTSGDLSSLPLTAGIIAILTEFFNACIGAVSVGAGLIKTSLLSLVAKTGFLGETVSMIPIMVGDLASGLSKHRPAVLEWHDIQLMGTTLIQSGSIDLDDFCSQRGMENLHSVAKMCNDAGILFFLSFKIYNKSLELIK